MIKKLILQKAQYKEIMAVRKQVQMVLFYYLDTTEKTSDFP